MDLIKTIEDLVRFRTETGHEEEIDKCLNYIAKSFVNTKSRVVIERFYIRWKRVSRVRGWWCVA